MNKIKDCPYCGGKPKLYWREVECEVCGATSPSADTLIDAAEISTLGLTDEEYDALQDQYEAEAIERWNKRDGVSSESCPHCNSDLIEWNGDRDGGFYECEDCLCRGPYVDLWKMALDKYQQRV